MVKKSIKLTNSEYWLLMRIKAEHKTEHPITVLAVLAGMVLEEIKPELTKNDQKIYDLLKIKPQTTGDLCLLLGVSRGRITQIMAGKDGADGLLKKRPDIRVERVSYNTKKNTTTLNHYFIEGITNEDV